MKVRNGFVSNSSSSSFILLAKEPLTEEFLRKEYGDKGPFAEPTVDFLIWKGDNELYDREDGFPYAMKEFVEQVKEGEGFGIHYEEKLKDGYFFKEYEITNQGEGEVSAALYYKGYKHLETPNIKVFPGTRYG